MLNHHSNTGKRLTTLVFLGVIAPLFSLISSGIDAAAAVTPADQSHWPAYGKVPPTNSPEVKAWLKLVDWTKVPKIGVRYTKDPGPPACPQVAAPASDCWWTCSGCAAPDDVTECPGKKVWGLTFDDGPEPGTTEKLLDLMHEKNVTATFFVTGMKSTKAPALLKQTIDKGHHLASHTWSHQGLTTLTNEQIVAELMWTEKFVFDHTGYKLKYFRPPYGDVDNRVRAIARQLGFKTVIWSNDWDTQDWQLPYKTITPNQIVNIFQKGISSIPTRSHGVITLEHDGAPQMVAMARTLLDLGIKSGLKPMDIASCLSDKVGYNAVPDKPAKNDSDEHITDGTGTPSTDAGSSRAPGEAVTTNDGPLQKGPAGPAKAKASILRGPSRILYAVVVSVALSVLI
ncbi:chitin deacetylase [Mortierella alpina]|nr:chitin deacetylase [Mortierella alpina]